MDFVLTLKIMFCGVFDFNFEFKNFFPEAEVWDFHATWISYQSEFLTFLNFQIEFSDYQNYGISDIRVKILNSRNYYPYLITLEFITHFRAFFEFKWRQRAMFKIKMHFI